LKFSLIVLYQSSRGINGCKGYRDCKSPKGYKGADSQISLATNKKEAVSGETASKKGSCQSIKYQTCIPKSV
jgi:hypothetical protein